MALMKSREMCGGHFQGYPLCWNQDDEIGNQDIDMLHVSTEVCFFQLVQDLLRTSPSFVIVSSWAP